jgi:hypothetical protein
VYTSSQVGEPWIPSFLSTSSLSSSLAKALTVSAIPCSPNRFISEPSARLTNSVTHVPPHHHHRVAAQPDDLLKVRDLGQAQFLGTLRSHPGRVPVDRCRTQNTKSYWPQTLPIDRPAWDRVAS